MINSAAAAAAVCSLACLVARNPKYVIKYTLRSPLNDFHKTSSKVFLAELAVWKSLRGECNVYSITHFG